jgi:hypothetical protein
MQEQRLETKRTQTSENLRKSCGRYVAVNLQKNREGDLYEDVIATKKKAVMREL